MLQIFKRVIVIAMLVQSSVAMAADLPSYPFVHVTGVATRGLPANMAELDFELTVLTPEPKVSYEKIVQYSDEISSQLLALGVSNGDIQAAQIKRYISPVEYLETAETQLKFRLIRSFHVIVRDLGNWNAVIAALTEKDYLGNFNVDFGRNDLPMIQQELIQLASVDAQQQAHIMAQAFKLKLGAPTGMSQSVLSSLSSDLGLSGQVKMDVPKIENKPTTRDFSIPAQLKYQQSVNVIFKLKQ